LRLFYSNAASSRFLPLASGEEEPASPPSDKVTLISFGLLLVSLIAIVGLAKTLTPAVETMILSLGAPEAMVGVAIATLVLTPESLAAFRAARADRLQTSLNLALGSALASTGLTIPAVAVAVVSILGQQLALGLDAKEIVLLALTLLVGVITFGHRPDDRPSGHCASHNLCCFSVYDHRSITLVA
jgi:Ca2+:H+ antiporter